MMTDEERRRWARECAKGRDADRHREAAVELSLIGFS